MHLLRGLGVGKREGRETREAQNTCFRQEAAGSSTEEDTYTMVHKHTASWLPYAAAGLGWLWEPRAAPLPLQKVEFAPLHSRNLFFGLDNS